MESSTPPPKINLEHYSAVQIRLQNLIWWYLYGPENRAVVRTDMAVSGRLHHDCP